MKVVEADGLGEVVNVRKWKVVLVGDGLQEVKGSGEVEKVVEAKGSGEVVKVRKWKV